MSMLMSHFLLSLLLALDSLSSHSDLLWQALLA